MVHVNQVRATQSLVLVSAGSILATNVPPCDLIHTTFRKRTDLRAVKLPGLLPWRRGISLCCWRKKSLQGWSFSRCVSFRNVFLGFMSWHKVFRITKSEVTIFLKMIWRTKRSWWRGRRKSLSRLCTPGERPRILCLRICLLQMNPKKFKFYLRNFQKMKFQNFRFFLKFLKFP